MDLISTVIRIHLSAIPTDLQNADADVTAAKIELPTVHLANACAALVVMRLITPLNLTTIHGN